VPADPFEVGRECRYLRASGGVAVTVAVRCLTLTTFQAFTDDPLCAHLVCRLLVGNQLLDIECCTRDWLLISRLKVRFLPRSPLQNPQFMRITARLARRCQTSKSQFMSAPCQHRNRIRP